MGADDVGTPALDPVRRALSLASWTSMPLDASIRPRRPLGSPVGDGLDVACSIAVCSPWALSRRPRKATTSSIPPTSSRPVTNRHRGAVASACTVAGRRGRAGSITPGPAVVSSPACGWPGPEGVPIERRRPVLDRRRRALPVEPLGDLAQSLDATRGKPAQDPPGRVHGASGNALCLLSNCRPHFRPLA